jgi:cell division protein FtsL
LFFGASEGLEKIHGGSAMATMAIGHEVGRLNDERTAAAAPRSRNISIAQRNYELFEAQRARRRGPTPEMFFTKHLDNTRLVKADDPQRRRDMRIFTTVMTVFFMLTMVYVWQHFHAIQLGYDIEHQKATVEQLREDNRQLRLTDAQLSEPSRIDHIAKQLGLDEPLPGQVIRQDASRNMAPALAEAQPPAVPLNVN